MPRHKKKKVRKYDMELDGDRCGTSVRVRWLDVFSLDEVIWDEIINTNELEFDTEGTVIEDTTSHITIAGSISRDKDEKDVTFRDVMKIPVPYIKRIYELMDATACLGGRK